MNRPILTVLLRHERDAVTARRRAHQIAELFEFDPQDQTRIATAVSEIARNAFRYTEGGEVTFEVAGEGHPQILIARVRDWGKGIPNLDRILRGNYRSQTGLGMGIVGSRRLMDHFKITSTPGEGTIVEMGKFLPRRVGPVTAQHMAWVAEKLAANPVDAPFDEIRQQNQELLRVLDELTQRQEELNRLNAELEDTNRGVMALYAELDEKAEHLRRADQLKSKFLSNMSHEFRTPLNSILALTRLLLDKVDGDLTFEQMKQVTFIRKGTESLIDLVNDLLDLAKVESGKVDVHPVPFNVADLFGTLRGMLRPLSLNESVNLLFETDSVIQPIVSDEGKVAQILRNLISNALKFTESGEVRVTAHLDPNAGTLTFAVADTGIGIPSEHQESIFQEFTQVENRLQRLAKGTGLGLPLSKKLAELLGGTITLESTPGTGSTFYLTIPCDHGCLQTPAQEEKLLARRNPTEKVEREKHVLIIDDEEISHYLIRQHLQSRGFEVRSARNGVEGIEAARREHPDVIILDLVMPQMTGFEVLDTLREDVATRDIPIVVFTSKELEPHEREWIDLHAAGFLSKEKLSGDNLRHILHQVIGTKRLAEQSAFR